VLEQGRRAEAGTHRELLSQKGLYEQLHAAQTGVGPILPVPFAAVEGA
jgi:ABC-type multidrug transport system fused ATPase/permease subunit